MRVKSRFLPLKTDSGYPKDAGVALVRHTGKPKEFPPREIPSSSGHESTSRDRDSDKREKKKELALTLPGCDSETAPRPILNDLNDFWNKGLV